MAITNRDRRPSEHGLYYIDRDSETVYQLDRMPVPVDRPERDVLVTLLRYALDHLTTEEPR